MSPNLVRGFRRVYLLFFVGGWYVFWFIGQPIALSNGWRRLANVTAEESKKQEYMDNVIIWNSFVEFLILLKNDTVALLFVLLPPLILYPVYMGMIRLMEFTGRWISEGFKADE